MRFALVLIFALVAGAAVAGPICFCPLCATLVSKSYTPVGTSMAPNLQPDQCVYARLDSDAPAPGDVVAFRAATGQDMIFRVIATPGQHVVVENGIPVIDGVAATRETLPPFIAPVDEYGSKSNRSNCADATCTLPRELETLPNGISYQVLNLAPDTQGDAYYEGTVPQGSLFLMGDNRDNAADSRFERYGYGPGFVPISDVIGVIYHPEMQE
ncbi:signal peptidase I [Paracoccus sediminicola]|uniref:signal peptidase I n=1 Tax=Paracoccus sediminicola TaxID=3017783 RepID=UPI0022F1224D|nr:signal peptidase I [Paracoccus sediminicola]WBU55608.1 signal peptidase I [Paracoccus sediminicola]